MSDDRMLKRNEDAKREAAWAPRDRWRVLQETMGWAEAQAAVPRNTPRGCLEAEQKRRGALLVLKEGLPLGGTPLTREDAHER